MRYAIIKYVLVTVTSFFNNLGIEAHGSFLNLFNTVFYTTNFNKKIFCFIEVAVLSPMIHATAKTLEGWLELLKGKLNTFNGPPDNYIPGCNLSSSSFSTGPKIFKYQSMLDPKNTPFV